MIAVGETLSYRLCCWEQRHFLNPAPNLSLKYGFLFFSIQLFLDEILPEKWHKYSPGRSEVGPLSRERYLLRGMIAGGGVPYGHGAA